MKVIVVSGIVLYNSRIVPLPQLGRGISTEAVLLTTALFYNAQRFPQMYEILGNLN